MRCEPVPGIIEFQSILRNAVKKKLDKSGESLDRYIESNLTRYWNYFKSLLEEDEAKGLYPLAIIKDNEYKKFAWFFSQNNHRLPDRKFHLLKARSFILQEIDKLSNREYEALGCFISELLGAQHVLLTPPGNEAGIDFISAIQFSKDAHFFFGINGPIRIIAQCKKYKSSVKVNSIKEFNQTLLDVFSVSGKIKRIIPDWFRKQKGPIIGWFISHSGFQSGAMDRAKNYGIIASDSRTLAEIIAGSKKFYPNMAPKERANMLKYEIRVRLS